MGGILDGGKRRHAPVVEHRHQGRHAGDAGASFPAPHRPRRRHLKTKRSAIARRHAARLHAGLAAPLLASLLMPRAVDPCRSPPTPADPSSFDDAAYWAFADRMQDQLDRYWDGEHLHAQARDASANLLLTHAAAALAGHTGPARRDDRALALVQALCEGRRGSRRPATGSQGHKPGWQDGIAGSSGIQHLVVDTEIAWPLMFAWQAREALGHGPGHRRPDRRPHHPTVNGRFWQWPTLRLNQINWYTRMYVAAATVGGDRQDLHTQLLQQVRRFVDGATQADERRDGLQPRRRLPLPLPAAGASTTSSTSTAPSTRTSSAASWSPTSRPATPGCRRWTPGGPRSCARGRERVLSGYWTHAGYLNWDTGLGFKRWHQGKKLGLSPGRAAGDRDLPGAGAARRVGQAHARPLVRALRPLGASATAACRRPTRSRSRRSTTTSPRR